MFELGTVFMGIIVVLTLMVGITSLYRSLSESKTSTGTTSTTETPAPKRKWALALIIVIIVVIIGLYYLVWPPESEMGTKQLLMSSKWPSEVWEGLFTLGLAAALIFGAISHYKNGDGKGARYLVTTFLVVGLLYVSDKVVLNGFVAKAFSNTFAESVEGDTLQGSLSALTESSDVNQVTKKSQTIEKVPLDTKVVVFSHGGEKKYIQVTPDGVSFVIPQGYKAEISEKSSRVRVENDTGLTFDLKSVTDDTVPTWVRLTKL